MNDNRVVSAVPGVVLLYFLFALPFVVITFPVCMCFFYLGTIAACQGGSGQSSDLDNQVRRTN